MRANAHTASHPGRELALYALGASALAAGVYGLGLPQPFFSLSAIPVPFLAMRWPRWALVGALLAVFALGCALSLLISDTPGAEVRRVAIQVLTLGVLTELVLRVVHSRTEALTALAVAEGRRRLLVESLNVVPWELDLATQRFVYVGPQAERLLGHPLSAWRDMASWEAMIHPDDRAEAVRFCAESTERGVGHEFEYRMLAADGREVWIRDIVTVARADGETGQLRGVMIDVTEQRRAGEVRIRLERRLLEGQRLESLGLLAGGVAHDFNNFLTPILGNVSHVLATESLSAGAQLQLRDVEAAAERAAEVARQMLAYSGRAKFVVHEEDLSRVVGETARLLAAGVSKRAVLKLDLREPIWVRAEVAQLRQVVMNLLTNAADAVEESGGTVAVRTGIAEPGAVLAGERPLDPPLSAGPCALLEVRDDGVGMDAETRRQVFDPFFTTKATGHGLGMAAVLGIIRSHGGAITIESELGTGTCVRVVLPLAEPPAASSATDDRAVRPAPGPLAPSRCVLVVDDEPSVRRVVRVALESSGYAVIEAGDGDEALATLRRAQARVTHVLLDMTMPRLSGSETLLRLRELAPDLPVLLMSGYAEQEFSATDAPGRTAFLAKPFRVAELCARLAELSAAAAQGLH